MKTTTTDRVKEIVKSVEAEIGHGELSDMLITDAIEAGMEYANHGDSRINTAVRDFFADACTFKPAGHTKGDYFWTSDHVAVKQS